MLREDACSPVVPVRVISCKWIFKIFTLWSSSPPISLSVLSAQVPVEVLPFILTLECTKLLWFLLSLFPSVLFIFFCTKSSVSYLSLISLFLSQMWWFLFNISMFSCQLRSHVPEGGLMLCVHVNRISQFMAAGFSRDQMCCGHTEPACHTCCISYFSWKHTQSQFCSWNECPVSSLNFPWVESCCVSLPELVLSQSHQV